MLTAFLIASLILAITPGPAVIYVLTRTLAHGRAAGFASLAGVALGNLGNAVGASIGLAALFAISTIAFTVVKFAGALYLIYLGIRALGSSRDATVTIRAQAPAAWPVLRDGFLVALLNPKTALFFAAFLPQFIDPAISPVMQTLMLGGLFVVVAACTDAVYVLVASTAAADGGLARIAGSARYGRYLTASTFIGLGIYTALVNPRAGK